MAPVKPSKYRKNAAPPPPSRGMSKLARIKLEGAAYAEHAARTRKNRKPGVTLAGLFDEHRIARCDLLKLDCEGAEYDALYGLPAEHRQRIRRCVVEYHADPNHKRARGDELVGWFARSGFRVDHYTDVVGEPVGHVFATRAG